MEKMNINNIIYQFKNEVCYYNQMQLYSMSPSEKNYYLNQIEERTQDVIMQLLLMENQDTNPILSNESPEIPSPNTSPSESNENPEMPIPNKTQSESNENSEIPSPNTTQSESNENPEIPISNTSPSEQKVFTLTDLAQFNGMNGKPAYVAVNGKIYDVTNVALWAGGRHNGLLAGKDLSAAFLGCHLGIPDRLEKLPKVGILKK